MTSIEIREALGKRFDIELSQIEVSTYLTRLGYDGVVSDSLHRIRGKFKVYKFVNPFLKILLELSESDLIPRENFLRNVLDDKFLREFLLAIIRDDLKEHFKDLIKSLGELVLNAKA